MNKIWIAGSLGSGKTTLANLIGKKYNIPVYHRDYISANKICFVRISSESTGTTEDFFVGRTNWNKCDNTKRKKFGKRVLQKT